MGDNLSAMYYTYVSHPDTAPNLDSPPTFDPLLGFPDGREERTVKTTREELQKARIPLEFRDYCVDYFMELMKCRQENFPLVKTYCKHEIHAWHECEKEDNKLRYMEYEREKRLLERAKRIKIKEEKEAM